MKRAVLLLLVALGGALFGAPEDRGQKTLIVSFDGKGTAMLWDAGVMRALEARLKPGAIDRFVFVGSSSGSIASSYFACRGLSRESLGPIQEHAKTFPKDILDEATNRKAVQLFLGAKVTTSLDSVMPFINIATQDGTCLPKIPLLIPAANLEVLDTRTAMPFAGTYKNQFDRGTYIVSRDGKALGKACTYFVNTEMLEILEAIPADERLCDIRVMRKASDLVLAIKASISEPTYYEPIPEVDMKALISVFALPLLRIYAGGFIMNSPVEIKRALPEAYAFGTGRTGYTAMQDGVIQNWFSTFTMNETLYNQRWWFDDQVVLSRTDWDQLYEKAVTPPMQVERGYQAALKCLAGKGPAREKSEKPFYSKDAWGNTMDKWRGRGLRDILL